uniref:protein-tyrosine-phosphatase n=1 Tax=Chromera velia CCMP2878 TaxID=1169474 RepID=A0A0G4G842_9ALVE|eukprot:Cvel_20639.t1-p1 / transcript=Cvel_20639.t1 / gene=Cvel_20639 / organism=Chromera_velia_CCMP2878 / gene_product=Dual specificity protein phosphatase CDC14A, putative / transcript_product=Dual specificity protein phosphatase CDC14A, putative / location=Cvel_scaffold1871:14012-16977(+) / protein_length=383 / sequence_SO=supercontig / SO=protein_coding / is_pseudo=false
MTERELQEAIEILPGRFYWCALHSVPKQTANTHYFCIDQELVYEPFFADFGPLSLGLTYRYCKMMERKLSDPALASKRIVHYCSTDPHKRANAAYLVGAFQIVVLNKPADDAYRPFVGIYPPFLPFRDATYGICTYHCTIHDCLKGLEWGIKLGWFDYTNFNLQEYEYFERVENGDLNWVIPKKFVAFSGPAPTATDEDGFHTFTPENYVPIFKKLGVTMVVRLNKKQYDRERFTKHGIKHVDLYFLDGSCPSREIILKFLDIVENEPGAVAVHCKAGLGRTGSLIGAYAIKHFRFPAAYWIGWNRITRPGSVLGPQQHFLCEIQNELIQMGVAQQRIRPAMIDQKEVEMTQARVGEMSADEQRIRRHGDQGQGERLMEAKRG